MGGLSIFVDGLRELLHDCSMEGDILLRAAIWANTSVQTLC